MSRKIHGTFLCNWRRSNDMDINLTNQPFLIILYMLWFPPKQIICCNVIQIRKRNQMPYGQFIGSPLISCIHRLRRMQIVGNLLLRHIMIFTQIAHTSCIVQAIHLTVSISIPPVQA